MAPNDAGAIFRLTRKAGVDHVALVQFVALYGYDNSYCADCAETDPQRYVAICSVDPFSGDAPEELTYWVRQRGMRGLRLFTPAGWVDAPTWPDVPTVSPIMERAESLGVPVCVQVQPHQLRRLKELASGFTRVPILVDHLGGVCTTRPPSVEEERDLWEFASAPNVYLKFSNQNMSLDPWVFRSLLRDLLERFGAGRLMWGSNFPVATGKTHPYGDLLSQARKRLVETMEEEERALLLGGTAVRVYGL